MYKIYRNYVEKLNPSFQEKEEIVSSLIEKKIVNLDEEPEMWREYINRDPDFEDLLRQEFNILDM